MIYRRKLPDGKRSAVWSFDFRVNGKHYHGSTRETKKDRAREVERQLTERARRGQTNVVEDVTFEQLSAEFMKLHGSRKKSAEFYANVTRVASRHFEKTMLSAIGPRQIEEFLTHRATYSLAAQRRLRVPGASAPVDSKATRNRYLVVLKLMFRKAVEWNFLESNPCASFKPERERARRENFLTAAQVELLLTKSPAYLRPLITAAVHTGGRRGELLGLTWERVNLEQRQLRFVDTKNGEDRAVPISETLAGVLRDLPSRFDGGAVFRAPDGKPLGERYFRSAFGTACRRAGLDSFRFHDLRHTAASFWVQAGVPLNTVRELLGHKSLGMTLRYAHLAPDHLREAATVMDRLLGGGEKSRALDAPPV